MECVGFNVHILHSRSAELPAALRLEGKTHDASWWLRCKVPGCEVRFQGSLLHCYGSCSLTALRCICLGTASAGGRASRGCSLWKQAEPACTELEWCTGVREGGRLRAVRVPRPLGEKGAGDDSRGCWLGVAAQGSSQSGFRNDPVCFWFPSFCSVLINSQCPLLRFFLC